MPLLGWELVPSCALASLPASRSPHDHPPDHTPTPYDPTSLVALCWVARCYDFSAVLDHLVYTGGQLGRGPYLARRARSSQSSNSVSLLVKAPVAVYTA